MKAVVSAGMMLLASITQVFAQNAAAPCVIDKNFTHFEYPLTRSAQKIATGQPLLIVALGSSSTAGYGASQKKYTYPAQLKIALSEMFPKNEITVLNHGTGREEIKEMRHRLVDGILVAEDPDLIILQAGANAVLHNLSIPETEIGIKDTIAIIRNRGIDVILMNSQKAPRIYNGAGFDQMTHAMDGIIQTMKIDMFNRYGLMAKWEEAGKSMNEMILPDNLHMNDWSNICIAKHVAHGLRDNFVRQKTQALAP